MITFALGMLFILALISLLSIHRKQRNRAYLVEAAKIRSKLRQQQKDVWEANIKAKFAQTTNVNRDLSESQYQTLMDIFNNTDSNINGIEVDYWKDSEPAEILK